MLWNVFGTCDEIMWSNQSQQRKKGNFERQKKFLDEYHDVFPYEINEPPPVQEVDKAIDLVANATPLSRVSYHLSLA